VNRGAVVWLDLSDASPPELSKRRPAIVVSNSVQNQVLDTLVAVPLSSRPPEIHPLRLRVTVPALKRASFAIVPGIRLVKKSRILGPAGRLSSADLARLDAAIRDYLSD
jgi:mRNA-degrading endonuclease toxin of MazEF toxin-antitoxin module